MACVDYATWQKAQVECAAITGVKGLGRSPYTLALRGLGAGPVTLNVSSSADPCVIARQTPCGPDGVTALPVGLKAAPKKVQTLISTTPDPSSTVTADTSTAGFSKMGLLALLAVGGFVVYKVATHKKGASA